MTGRERALGAFNRTGYDRIPVKHEGTPEVNQMIMDHFGLTNMEQLLRVVGDDFRYVELPYTGPELRTFPDGSMEGYWGERYKYAQFEGGKYLEPSYLPFAGIDKLEELDRSHFPSSDWFDYSTVRTQCEHIRDAGYAVCFGTAGDMDFINSIARARGTEQVLIDLITDNEVYLDIMQARFRFYYEMHERVLQAAENQQAAKKKAGPFRRRSGYCRRPADWSISPISARTSAPRSRRSSISTLLTSTSRRS